MSTRTALCVRTQKSSAEKVIRDLDQERLVDHSLKFSRDDRWLNIPLIMLNDSQIRALSAKGYEVSKADFDEPPPHRPRSLLDALKGRLPSEALGELPKAFDIIGEIAIVEIPQALRPYENQIGEAILRISSRLRLVLSKHGPVEDEFRVRSFKAIAGSGRTVTQHREHGAIFRLDVSNVYFNPRLSHEHLRIAQQVGAGETVVDMFAGIGPFPILIARRHPNVSVFAVELNPQAYAYLQENIRINKVHEKVTPILGDCRQLAKTNLALTADRVIMNYPADSASFIEAACRILRGNGGVVHFYSFQSPAAGVNPAEKQFRSGVENAGRKVTEIMVNRFVREVAPYRYLHVLDARVS